jgi:hypothetical protein
VYATDEFELLACDHCVLIVPIFSVDHFFVGLYVPVIVIFVFDCGLVEDLRWADMVVAGKPATK